MLVVIWWCLATLLTDYDVCMPITHVAVGLLFCGMVRSFGGVLFQDCWSRLMRWSITWQWQADPREQLRQHQTACRCRWPWHARSAAERAASPEPQTLMRRQCQVAEWRCCPCWWWRFRHCACLSTTHMANEWPGSLLEWPPVLWHLVCLTWSRGPGCKLNVGYNIVYQCGLMDDQTDVERAKGDTAPYRESSQPGVGLIDRHSLQTY